MNTQLLTNHFDLRQKAEEKLTAKELQLSMDLTYKDLYSLNQELLIHQIELEMQNDKLGKAYENTEQFLEKYINLYNLAPVGYILLQKRVKLQRQTTVPITCWKENKTDS